MRPGGTVVEDYLNIVGSEDLTATAAGATATASVPVHHVTTDGSAGTVKVTLGDGTVAGQRHIFLVVAVGHASDTLRIYCSGPGATTYCHWNLATTLGCAVELIWDGTDWVIGSACLGGSGYARFA